MKATKYRELDVAELERQTQDTQEQLFRLRFQIGMGQTEGLKKYRNLKKDRARLLTVLAEKKTGSETAVAEVRAVDAKKALPERRRQAKRPGPTKTRKA
jgi:large subunit ribosomal protein L29